MAKKTYKRHTGGPLPPFDPNIVWVINMEEELPPNWQTYVRKGYMLLSGDVENKIKLLRLAAADPIISELTL